MEQVLERIIATSDSVGPSFLWSGLERAKAVGRIVTAGESGILSMATGFLISNRHVLTCNHAIPSIEVALQSEIGFDFYVKDDGTASMPSIYRFSPEGFFATNEQLDITIVQLADSAGLAGHPHIQLPRSRGNILAGERMSLIHHSGGEPLRFSLRGPMLLDIADDFLHYSGHSGAGSAGAPLFNDHWTLVGIHHAAVPASDEDGRVLARDGSVWTAGSKSEIQWLAQEAVRASRVVRWLDDEGLSDLDSVDSAKVVSPRLEDQADTSCGFIPEPESPTRDSVFISYAHDDQKVENWKDRLALQLSAIPSIGETRVWEDSRIQPGQDWLREIEYALQRTRVAIFLVGPHFLNSEFILTKELPPMIEAAQQDGVRIFPLITDYSPYSLSVLSKYQSFNDPLEPLESLARSDQNRILLSLATEVAQVFSS